VSRARRIPTLVAAFCRQHGRRLARGRPRTSVAQRLQQLGFAVPEIGAPLGYWRQAYLVIA
jgi:hypothetical protein